MSESVKSFSKISKSRPPSSSSRRSSITGQSEILGPVTMPASTFDPKLFFVAQSVCRLTGFDKFGNEREGTGFLCTIRQPLRSSALNHFGILTNSSVFVGADGRSFTDAGALPTVLIDAHFAAHTHQHTVPLVIRRDIVKWFVSRTLDLVFLEFRNDAEFLRRKSYNFLSLETAFEGQRLMIFRYPTKDSKTARCGYGKVVQLCENGHIKWDHSVPNLPAGTPLIVAETLKVIGVHQTDRGDADKTFDEAISIKAFLNEMQAEGFLDDTTGTTNGTNTISQSLSLSVKNNAKPPQNNNSNNFRNHAASLGSSTFGSLLKSVTHLRNAVSPRNNRDSDLQLGSIRDSSVIANNLKDGICLVLQKHGVSANLLSTKSEHDLKKLFHQGEHLTAIRAWKQELDILKKKKLEHDAANLHLAAKTGNFNLASSILREKLLPRQWLVEHRDSRNFNNTPLIQAALNGHLDIVELLVTECEADVFAKDGHELESTAVHLAAAYGRLDIVSFLTDHNSALIEAKNKNNDTPLNRAASRGQLKVVEFLVDQKRADVENRGELGRTPLLMAATWGHLSIVEFLVKRGANFFAKDTETESMAPHLAAYFGHANVVHFLLDRYPDMFSLRNRNGKTPLARARAQQKLNVVHLLEARGARE